MDGAVTGQFEQHLRAVLDLPLGDPSTRAPWTVMANVLGGEHDELYSAYRHVLARDPGVKVHLYGKAVRPGRKIGHVNVSARSLTDARARATHAADYIAGAIDE
jgi:5-(carboxyamino)imidazole ribonucleotide synthase